jgi:predicted RND superfamily exporter protein
VAVAVILVLDFRALRVVLLAMVPLAVGILQMLGLLGWLGIPLNPANMIVLPLILGIGIDDGVHVIHDYRTQQGRFRLSNSTATAILMTSLTSMVGFGSLMIASHRGLESLGRVLTIGVCCCLFTSLTILPAVLTWISANYKQDAHPGPRAAASAPSPRSGQMVA